MNISTSSVSAGKGHSLDLHSALLFLALFVVLLAGRLCHAGVLWVDEAYGMAGARAMLDGNALYRDIWFDKPPLYAWIYLLVGGQPGWLLRALDAVFSLFCCGLAFGLARELWGNREAKAAASLLAFFFLFGIPSATVSLAPDLLTIPFALGAAWLAAAGRPGWAGFVAGAALLANAKAVFLFPVLLFWVWPRWAPLATGYLGGVLLTPLELATKGAVLDYWQQVWVWGGAYSRDTHLEHPIIEGVRRTANWIGFHSALVIPAALCVIREPNTNARRLSLWFLLALASVAGGMRFFPRYYFAILPVAAILAARGVWLIPPKLRVVFLVITLAIPAVRFGKPQLQLAAETLRGDTTSWSDLSLYVDAREAARFLKENAGPGDTILVWGYRPELNVLSGLSAGTRFLDSQPLTGVIADRHLDESRQTFPELAARNRQDLTKTSPTWIADGLGPINPVLAITNYPQLAPWLAAYDVVPVPNTNVIVYRHRDTTSEIPASGAPIHPPLDSRRTFEVRPVRLMHAD